MDEVTAEKTGDSDGTSGVRGGLERLRAKKSGVTAVGERARAGSGDIFRGLLFGLEAGDIVAFFVVLGRNCREVTGEGRRAGSGLALRLGLSRSSGNVSRLGALDSKVSSGIIPGESSRGEGAVDEVGGLMRSSGGGEISDREIVSWGGANEDALLLSQLIKLEVDVSRREKTPKGLGRATRLCPET